MKTIVTAFLLALVSIASICAQDLDFTKAELLEAKSEFTVADQELNRVYKIAESTLDEDQFLSLRAEQRDWVSIRDAIARFAVVQNGLPGYEGREEESIHYWHNLTHRSELRAREIQAWVDLEGVVDWSGYWTDGNASGLLIRERPDTGEFDFDVTVVFGRSLRSEGLFGRAEINDNLALYKYETRSKGGEGWAVFRKYDDSPRLELIPSSHDPGRYCGGIFTRIRDLTEEERGGHLDAGIGVGPVNDPEEADGLKNPEVANGFRDVKLGIGRDEMQDLQFLRAEKIVGEIEGDRDFEFYARTTEFLSFHGVKLSSIQYGFSGGGLERIRVRAEGLAAFTKLSEVALSRYGGKQDDSFRLAYEYEYDGEQTSQTLYVHYDSEEDSERNVIGHSWIWGVPETGWRLFYLTISYDAETNQVVQELTVPEST